MKLSVLHISDLHRNGQCFVGRAGLCDNYVEIPTLDGRRRILHTRDNNGNKNSV